MTLPTARKTIDVYFGIGDTVYIYDPTLLSRYSIEEVRIMRIEILKNGIIYKAQNGYDFFNWEIGLHVFESFEEAVKAMGKRG